MGLYKFPSSKGIYFKGIYNFLVSYRNLLLPPDTAGLPGRAKPPLHQTGLSSQCRSVHHPTQHLGACQISPVMDQAISTPPSTHLWGGHELRGTSALLPVTTVHECVRRLQAFDCRLSSGLSLEMLKQYPSQLAYR